MVQRWVLNHWVGVNDLFCYCRMSQKLVPNHFFPETCFYWYILHKGVGCGLFCSKIVWDQSQNENLTSSLKSSSILDFIPLDFIKSNTGFYNRILYFCYLSMSLTDIQTWTWLTLEEFKWKAMIMCSLDVCVCGWNLWHWLVSMLLIVSNFIFSYIYAKGKSKSFFPWIILIYRCCLN